ncbi:Rapid ALkalinization Factor [Macleaya cordata]|uniref:Rapid ALkalinization Factor n=1 Tax=Macleaya cordata TaxID=56857 RepID=A0A200QYW5_MACCD|nr:Rapid ALkalinization Factor [Macleaya cordata]
MAFLCSAPSSKLLLLCFFCLFYFLSCSNSSIRVVKAEEEASLMSEVLESTNISSLVLLDFEEEEFGEEAGIGVAGRRSLVWKTMHYYISYGALSANRVPCPPRSGRSYYTNNCYRSNTPAQPYSRGCSKITRCRR